MNDDKVLVQIIYACATRAANRQDAKAIPDALRAARGLNSSLLYMILTLEGIEEELHARLYPTKKPFGTFASLLKAARKKKVLSEGQRQKLFGFYERCIFYLHHHHMKRIGSKRLKLFTDSALSRKIGRDANDLLEFAAGLDFYHFSF